MECAVIESTIDVVLDTGAHAARRPGRHRAPLFHRGRHRAPFVVPLANQGRYAVVVGVAVLAAGAVALGTATALPVGAPDSAVSPAVDVDVPGDTPADFAGGRAAAPVVSTRGSERRDTPITEQPAEKYWRPPLSHYDLTSLFGVRWGMPHKGLDFAAAKGTPVHAAYPGTVKSAGWNSGGFGYLVIIDHGDGLETYYAHNTSVVVSPGDKVSTGDHISNVGNTGNSLGPHCHFEVHRDGRAIDPLPFLLHNGVDVRALADHVATDDRPMH